MSECEYCREHVPIPAVLEEPWEEDGRYGVTEVRIAVWDDGGHGMCLPCLVRDYPHVVGQLLSVLVPVPT